FAATGAIVDAVSPLATFDLRSASATLAGGALVDGGFASIGVGTGVSAPQQVYLVAHDKSGNATSQLLVGQDLTAPQLDVTAAFIQRKGVGIPDSVSLVDAYPAPDCVVAQVTLARASSGSPVEVTWVPDAGGLIDMGTATNAPQRVWA